MFDSNLVGKRHGIIPFLVFQPLAYPRTGHGVFKKILDLLFFPNSIPPEQQKKKRI